MLLIKPVFWVPEGLMLTPKASVIYTRCHIQRGCEVEVTQSQKAWEWLRLVTSCSLAEHWGGGGGPSPCTYLREVHLGLAEGDALDVRQREVMFSEPLCKRKAGAQGLVGRAVWWVCLGGSGRLPFPAPRQETFCTPVPLNQAVLNSK